VPRTTKRARHVCHMRQVCYMQKEGPNAARVSRNRWTDRAAALIDFSIRVTKSVGFAR
jgi:hypothetical protein